MVHWEKSEHILACLSGKGFISAQKFVHMPKMYECVADAIRHALLHGQGAAIVNIGDLEVDQIIERLSNVVHVTAEEYLAERPWLKVDRNSLVTLSGYNSSYASNIEQEKDLQAIVRHHVNQDQCSALVLAEDMPDTKVFGHDYWWFNGPFGSRCFQVSIEDQSVVLTENKIVREGGYRGTDSWKPIDREPAKFAL